MTVKTRFAPSPTGYLHIGGARTALFSWLYARRHGGQFVLRVEDTDRERSTQEAVDAILDGMGWLGLDWDEGPYYQTQRFDRYRAVIAQLLAQGHAYHCFCSRERLDALRAEQMANKQKPRYDGCCRDLNRRPEPGEDAVIRFKNPLDGSVTIDDRVRGTVVYNNSELDDLIIARTDGTPTYNLTVVVDDMDMGITHVIRGDDHLNNTPRQINILKALGAPLPVYAHVPMILDEEGKKLSKRTGAASVTEYRDAGYLPEAVRNYLARLGWSHGDQEVFSSEELIKLFDINDINASASRLNPGKLDWLNQHYMKALGAAALAERLAPWMQALGVDVSQGPPLDAVVAVQFERAKTLKELAEHCLFYYQDPTGYDEKAATKQFKGDALTVLSAVEAGLAVLDEWQPAAIHGVLEQVVADTGLKFGKVGPPVRLAVTGGGPSPSLDELLALVGKEATLRRLNAAKAFVDAG